MDGILIIDKPSGMTSHDVVNRVRRVSGQRRVGHAGTLDPLATGVLVVCLGQATRLSEYLAGSAKSYRAGVRLGTSTDTQDAEGQVVAQRPVNVGREDVARALDAFRGPIMQVPPMYSAVKHQGQSLYKLARQGVTVERQARPVEILALELVGWAPPDLELVVRCTAGTYVRTLAHDLGERLGCGAHLTALRRESSGAFSLADAAPLAQLEAQGPSALARHLLPMARALREWPALHFDEASARRLAMGQAVPLPPSEAVQGADMACAFGPGERLIGLVRMDRTTGTARPEKIFSLDS